MAETIKISSSAENAEMADAENIEAAGSEIINTFEKENEVFAEIIPEQFAERIEMAREENSRIGGALQRFQGRAARMVGMTMLGLSLSWGVPHGVEAAGPQQKVEMRDDRYEAAQQALQESGIILPMDAASSKDMRHLGALIEADNILSQRVRSESMELAVQVGRLEKDDKQPGSLFESQVTIVEELISKAEKINQAAGYFSRESSPHAYLYDHARKQVEAGKRMIEEVKNPSEKQQQIWKIREMIDKWEKKEKEQKLGLEMREVNLLKELRAKLKELKGKSPEALPSVQQEKKLSPLRERPTAGEETPAETLERIRKDFQGHRERIERMTPQVQEEMKKILTPQDKK